jgi:hypothetical protein
MNFKISALNHSEFEGFFSLSDKELEHKGIKRMIVDEKPGFPCRVSLEDAELGEEVILVSHEFHKTASPYRSLGPVFIRKGVTTKSLENNEIPIMLNHRLLSFRGYDKDGYMKAAVTEKGTETRTAIEKIFDDSNIEYIHIHNSGPGCYNCEVRRTA